MWKKLNVKNKILIVFLPLVIVSIITITCVCIFLLTNSNREKAMQNSQDKIVLVSRQLDTTVSHLCYNIKAFSTSEILLSSLRQNFTNDVYGQYLFSSAMTSAIHNIMNVDTFVLTGYIQTQEGKIYNIPSGTLSLSATQQQIEKYTKISKNGGKISLSKPTEFALKNGSCITVEKSIIDVQSGKQLGALVFELDEKQFYETYCNVASTEDESFFILDDKNIILSASNRDYIGREFIDETKIILSENTTEDFSKFVFLSNPCNL